MTAPAIKSDTPELLEARRLVKYFPVENTDEVLRAVDGVSFSIRGGETLGLVGESGCGKSTVGRCVLRLYEPTSGQVFFEGREITHIPNDHMLRLRREMQIIFQDPYSSLDPRLNILSIVGEPLKIHGTGNKQERRERVA